MSRREHCRPPLPAKLLVTGARRAVSRSSRPTRPRALDSPNRTLSALLQDDGHLTDDRPRLPSQCLNTCDARSTTLALHTRKLPITCISGSLEVAFAPLACLSYPVASYRPLLSAAQPYTH